MSIQKALMSFLNQLPYVRSLYQRKVEYDRHCHYPPGHFYSSIVAIDEIKKREDKIWPAGLNGTIPGVNMNVEGQKNLIKKFEEFYHELPFKFEKTEEFRFFYDNGYYTYSDAIFLYCFIRYTRPKQIVEMGSGFSSAVMMDTNQKFFDNKIRLTFIEPYPDRLRGLMRKEDSANRLIVSNVQDVDLSVFENLEAGDIVFVDSSHVAKTGSDLNFILFDIIPRLKSGVYIHFHDVFHSFEYPKEWVYQGRNWNEDYFLRAFLMYNNDFEVSLFSNFLHQFHSEIFKEMPLCYKDTGGNLWLLKK